MSGFPQYLPILKTMQKDSVQFPRCEDAEHGTITACDKNDCFSMTTRKKAAFTMAEVLITLMILGVIAMIVVPGAIQKANDRATVVQVKKAYSELSRAMNMAIAENGTLDQWDWPADNSSFNPNNYNYFAKTLSKYLHVRKFCGDADGCLTYGWNSEGKIAQNGETTYFKGLKGGINENFATESYKHGKMALSNGSTILVSNVTGNHPQIIIDINGQNGPNTMGMDVFYFEYTNRLQGYAVNNQGSKACSTVGGVTKGHLYDGLNCSVWILKHGNMDYKYRDVSAEW